MNSQEIYNQLSKSIKDEYEVKYSELKNDQITIYRTYGDKWGALNEKFISIVKPIYDSIEYLSNRRVFICVNFNKDKSQTDSDYFFIDRQGKLINELKNIGYINTRDTFLFSFRDSNSNHWGLLSEKFDILIKPSFDRITSLTKNINLVKLNNKYGFISNNENSTVKLKYDEIFLNRENPNKHIALENGEYKLIDCDGISEDKLPYSHIFKGDCNSYGGRIHQYSSHLKVLYNGKTFDNKLRSIDDLTTYSGFWGIINMNGDEIIAPEFNYIDFFNESTNFKVLIGEIETKIDENNKLNISGFACGVISQNQERVIKVKYNWIDEISPTLYKVNLGGQVIYNDDYQEDYWMAIGGKWGVINEDGKIIVPIEYDNIMTNWFRVKELIIVQNGATAFNPKLAYEAYELNGQKVINRKVNYLEHMYCK